MNADDFSFSREQAVANLLPNAPERKVLAGLKSSLLWFGHDDTGSRLLKLPNGTPVSPAELTARAIAAIQTSSYMRPLPPSFQWIPPAATLFFCLWLTRWRKSRLWPGAFAAAVMLGVVSLYLYRTGHWWMPLVPSLALLAATVILSYVLPAPGRRTQPALATPAPVKTSPAIAPVRSKQPSPPPPAAAPVPPAEATPNGAPAPSHQSHRGKKRKKKRR